MSTINREDALKVVQEILDFVDDPTEKGTARLILKLIELIPDSGSYTRGQVEKIFDAGAIARISAEFWGKLDEEEYSRIKNEYFASLPAHGDGWVSVEERLPDDLSFVLASIKTSYDHWVEAIVFADGSFILPERGRTGSVTHWMPLPKKPTT